MSLRRVLLLLASGDRWWQGRLAARRGFRRERFSSGLRSPMPPLVAKIQSAAVRSPMSSSTSSDRGRRFLVLPWLSCALRARWRRDEGRGDPASRPDADRAGGEGRAGGVPWTRLKFDQCCVLGRGDLASLAAVNPNAYIREQRGGTESPDCTQVATRVKVSS